MKIGFDKAKRDKTYNERGLDFADADLVFAGWTVTAIDERTDYGETRYITAGFLAGRMIILCWTLRGEDCHVISMRKANDREIKRYAARFPKAAQQS